MKVKNAFPALCLLGTVAVGLWGLSSDPRQLMEILLVFAMAQSWNLLCGYTGLLSFGHQAFVGLGAYALFMCTDILGVSPYWGLGASVAAAMAAALVMTMLLQGMRDAYFSIGIWVLADSVRLLVGQWQLAGGSQGLVLNLPPGFDASTLPAATLWLAAGLALFTFGGLFWLLRSKVGLALTAIRDNERGAASVGIATRQNRLVAFLLSAAVCGLAGGIYFLSVLYVDPAGAFDLDWQIGLFFIVIVGGLGTLEGPVVGTLVYYALRMAFRGNGPWFAICEGSVAAAVIFIAPQGIWGTLQSRLGWRVFPIEWATR